MAICKHCEGTGVAPDKLTLECIGCQRKVTVTFRSLADLTEKCLNVLCSDCKTKEGTDDETQKL